MGFVSSGVRPGTSDHPLGCRLLGAAGLEKDETAEGNAVTEDLRERDRRVEQHGA